MPRIHGGRVTVVPTLPGAPRERRVAPITAMRRPDRLRDDLRPAATNTGVPVWGRPVAPVTGRKALKRPGWTSKVAGPSHL